MDLDKEFEKQIESASSLPDLGTVLQNLLSGNYNVWRNGLLMSIKVLVDRVDGLRIEIRHNEHAPPHFHVIGNDFDASYSILDGSLLNGRPNHIQERLVRWWYDRSRSKLISIWNNTRPSGCPVGPINMQ